MKVGLFENSDELDKLREALQLARNKIIEIQTIIKRKEGD